MEITIETALPYYCDNDAAHGFDHVLRVFRMAERIAQVEGADLAIVRAAALLHDAGRAAEQATGICHAQASAAQAREILHEWPFARAAAVAQAIAEHRFRGDRGPSSLEARVLYDADKLDAIGAIGVARAYAVAGAQRQHLWAAVPEGYADRSPHSGREDLGDAEHTPVHEYMFKLGKLAERMTTATGRRIAAERHRFMATFFARLEREISGEV